MTMTTSEPRDPNAPVLVTFETARQARAATQALLADERVDEPLQVAVHSDPTQLDTVPLRLTRARPYAIIGGTAVGSALALLGAVASATGAISIPMWIAALVGLLTGLLYGSIFGGIAGATELRPRLQKLRHRLTEGRAAVRVQVPPRDAPVAQRLLLAHEGARRAL